METYENYICPNCNEHVKNIDGNYLFCPYCGTELRKKKSLEIKLDSEVETLVYEWLSKMLKIDPWLVSETVENQMATVFLLIWPILETKIFNSDMKYGQMIKVANQVSSKISYKSIDDIFLHFHERFQDEDKYRNLTNKHDWDRIEQILRESPDDVSKKRRITFLIYVVYRYRNNIFHGKKSLREWDRFSKEIQLCIKFMIILGNSIDLDEKDDKRQNKIFEASTNVNNFYDEIIKEKDNLLIAIRYLQARGFLLECVDREWVLSDNSHESDVKELKGILNTLGIGTVGDKGKIQIEKFIEVEKLRSLFECNYVISHVAERNDRSWRWFKRRKHGYKVPTMLLEPFVAMYVKAVSACGIETWFSCDGNNHGYFSIVIGFNGNPNRIWHKILWENMLNSRFTLPWNNTYEAILLENKKYTYYVELNRAANYLYANRLLFRDLKKYATKVITHALERDLSDEDIEVILRERVDEYLKLNSIQR